MIKHPNPSRRTVLGTLAVGVLGGLAGCSAEYNGQSSSAAPFSSAFVAGTDLIVGISDDATIDRINVVQPDGSLFAQRKVSVGVERETFPLGTDYRPGEYRVLGIVDDEILGGTVINILPDVRITDVKLARNHLEEMYEGASNSEILSEAIVEVTNAGTGPDAITQLRFEGDVPLPTRDIFQESRIYDSESELGGHADKVVVPAGEKITLFSSSRPFSPAGGYIICNQEGFSGDFSVIIFSSGSGIAESSDFSIQYTGVDRYDCQITIGDE